ncbi:hypothetical protein CASFOL_039813 [Castilleja foliolosa]|uniref:Uncharacterized protein n=1 Tax=Castilleja foliolosa TaxID=1961234 RepID=A0ABD3BG93_9LAMI
MKRLMPFYRHNLPTFVKEDQQPICRWRGSANLPTFVKQQQPILPTFVKREKIKEAGPSKTCFQKTIKKMFSMSKAVAERSSDTKEVESVLPLHTTVIE